MGAGLGEPILLQ